MEKLKSYDEIKARWPGVVGLGSKKHFWLDDTWEEISGWDVPWGDDRWEDYLPPEGLEFIGDLIRYKYLND